MFVFTNLVTFLLRC